MGTRGGGRRGYARGATYRGRRQAPTPVGKTARNRAIEDRSARRASGPRRSTPGAHGKLSSAGMVGPAVELRGVRKAFGARTVLDGIELAVEPGTILGYIGPNGAGKSTTVKILCGLLPSFEGEARVLGLDPSADPLAAKRKIGYVPENAVLYELLSVAEFLLLVGRLHGLEDELVKRRVQAFLAVFELADRLGARIQSLSKGMRQKVLLTSALLADPEVVF